MQIATQARIASSVQEASSVVETQVQKGDVIRQTLTQAVTQTEGVI